MTASGVNYNIVLRKGVYLGDIVRTLKNSDLCIPPWWCPRKAEREKNLDFVERAKNVEHEIEHWIMMALFVTSFEKTFAETACLRPHHRNIIPISLVNPIWNKVITSIESIWNKPLIWINYLEDVVGDFSEYSSHFAQRKWMGTISHGKSTLCCAVWRIPLTPLPVLYDDWYGARFVLNGSVCVCTFGLDVPMETRFVYSRVCYV